MLQIVNISQKNDMGKYTKYLECISCVFTLRHASKLSMFWQQSFYEMHLIVFSA